MPHKIHFCPVVIALSAFQDERVPTNPIHSPCQYSLRFFISFYFIIFQLKNAIVANIWLRGLPKNISFELKKGCILSS